MNPVDGRGVRGALQAPDPFASTARCRNDVLLRFTLTDRLDNVRLLLGPQLRNDSLGVTDLLGTLPNIVQSAHRSNRIDCESHPGSNMHAA